MRILIYLQISQHFKKMEELLFSYQMCIISMIVRQIEVHTAEPLVPGTSLSEVGIAIAKLEKYRSPGTDQIPAELIQARGEILLSEIHKPINSV
jgi:hypothetical protein